MNDKAYKLKNNADAGESLESVEINDKAKLWDSGSLYDIVLKDFVYTS